MICNKCNQKNDQSATFCKFCGNKIEELKESQNNISNVTFADDEIVAVNKQNNISIKTIIIVVIIVTVLLTGLGFLISYNKILTDAKECVDGMIKTTISLSEAESDLLDATNPDEIESIQNSISLYEMIIDGNKAKLSLLMERMSESQMEEFYKYQDEAFNKVIYGF